MRNGEAGMTLDEYKAHWDAVYARELDNSWVVFVLRMFTNDRVCLGSIDDPFSYEDGWCYPDRALALRAAQEWNGRGDPLDGWVKHISTGRCRVDGDPARESIGWPAP